jgi:hypothetical protein
MPSPLSLRRLCAAPLFIALLSAVVLGGVQDASCEMHGLGAARAGAPAGEQQMANHVATAAGSHESGGGEHGHGSGGCDCTCIGACTVSAPLATPPAAIMLRVALVEPERTETGGIEPAHSLPRAPDRLLPFANGPPSASA